MVVGEDHAHAASLAERCDDTRPSHEGLPSPRRGIQWDRGWGRVPRLSDEGESNGTFPVCLRRRR
jgi:hypothetical protein